MTIPQILAQARTGRIDLAAKNLGASGFSERGLAVLVRLLGPAADPQVGWRVLYSLYRAGRNASY